MKLDAIYRSVGIGGRRALDLESVGVLRALDLYRVCQIADRPPIDTSRDGKNLVARARQERIRDIVRDVPRTRS